MSCKWTGRGTPRVVTGRHGDDCQGEPCPGCQPCTEPHCVVCSIAHAEGACAECVAEARANLREIGRLCHALPEEVEHRGIDGEAMVLLGPAADPEARGHLEASVAAGRVPADYLEVANDESHPLYVTGSWLMVWQDALEHDDEAAITVEHAIGYLDRQLSYMADYPHVPFEDFARDLRRCVAHLEAVLHDGEQIERGAPCMTCGTLLTRFWGDDRDSDGWECRRCRERSSEAQYRFAVAHLHRAEAKELTDRDAEIRTGVKAGTIRQWARRGLVSSRRDSGRVVYLIEDIEARVRGEEAS